MLTFTPARIPARPTRRCGASPRGAESGSRAIRRLPVAAWRGQPRQCCRQQPPGECYGADRIEHDGGSGADFGVERQADPPAIVADHRAGRPALRRSRGRPALTPPRKNCFRGGRCSRGRSQREAGGTGHPIRRRDLIETIARPALPHLQRLNRHCRKSMHRAGRRAVRKLFNRADDAAP
jgi:hypothetical protein